MLTVLWQRGSNSGNKYTQHNNTHILSAINGKKMLSEKSATSDTCSYVSKYKTRSSYEEMKRGRLERGRKEEAWRVATDRPKKKKHEV